MSIAEKLTTIAENQQAVYDAGLEAERNTLWNGILSSGREDWSGVFRNWQDSMFYPTKDIIIPANKSAAHFIRLFNFPTKTPFNLKQRLVDCDVSLNTSAATDMQYFASHSYITHLPQIDFSSCTTLSNCFLYAYELVSVSIVLKSDGSQTFSSAFRKATKLEELEITGTIGQNGFDVSTSPLLTHDSLMSIINALQTKTSGTWAVTLGADNLAKLTDAEKAIATEKGWTLA